MCPRMSEVHHESKGFEEHFVIQACQLVQGFGGSVLESNPEDVYRARNRFLARARFQQPST